MYELRQTRGKSMDEKLLKKGVKYVVKIGRNRVAVRLIQKNADGVSYLVRNLKTLKPFFVKSAKSFADFQNEDERTKALKAIEAENAPIIVGEASKLSKESKVPKVSKISNESKVAKNPKIMGSASAPSSRLSGAWATTARGLGKYWNISERKCPKNL